MNKKDQERRELHKSIWKIANDLRGAVDSWDFKQYVFGMLFYRFISENLVNHFKNYDGVDYAALTDEQAEHGRSTALDEKGFFLLPSELFSQVLKTAKNNENINETIAKILKNIEASAIGTSSENDIKGLFSDFDVNSNKLGNTIAERNRNLINLMQTISDIQFGDFTENAIDAFGDAYEYLMAMYASNAGKSGGEFFTPQEVSELLAEITTMGKTRINKVYDPACGSGSLLLRFTKVLGKDGIDGFYGQEKNPTTYNLCRMNMFLHNIGYEKFDIALGDTLMDPKHKSDEPFDAIVSNPPYSLKWEGDSNPILIDDPRFSPAGILAPKSKADLAFTMHMLSWLSESGTAAIVEFPGVLYRSGAEQKIREYLVKNNYVDAVIQLPSDLFFGTSIATCILILKKNKTDNTVLFIDASAEFVRTSTKNTLSDANRAKILDAIKKRENQEYFAQLVDFEEIKNNEYNLSVSSYLTPEDTTEEIDIYVLNAEIAKTVERQSTLRTQIDAIVADISGENSVFSFS